jgi:hypothetical protein
MAFTNGIPTKGKLKKPISIKKIPILLAKPVIVLYFNMAIVPL